MLSSGSLELANGLRYEWPLMEESFVHCHFHSGDFRGFLNLAIIKVRKLGDCGITNLDLGCLR